MAARRDHTQSLVLAALMTALTVVCAQIHIPLPPVPVSLSLFAVCLCGAIMGARWGAFSMAAYVLLGVIGLPVFAGFHGGPSALFGPTGGFILGYIPCAYISGSLCKGQSRIRYLALSMFAATLVCYVPGLLWLKLVSGVTWQAAFTTGMLPFLPGDCLKALLAAMLAKRLRSALHALSL